MNALLEKIRSRGYWRVVIRPGSFDARRVSDMADLYPILQRTSVQLRGWDFPHLSNGEPDRGQDYISQSIDWSYYVALWRFYQSGQFIHYAGIVDDWEEQYQSDVAPPKQAKRYSPEPGIWLSPVDAMFGFTEIFEFASRLTVTEVSDGQTHLEITVVGLKDRTLQDQPGWLAVPGGRRSPEAKMHYQRDFSNVQLIAERRQLALEATQCLFQHFGWNPGLGFLKEVQTELLRRSAHVAR